VHAWSQIQYNHAQARALLPIPGGDSSLGQNSANFLQTPLVEVLVPPNMTPGVILIIPTPVPDPRQAAQSAPQSKSGAQAPPVGLPSDSGREGRQEPGNPNRSKFSNNYTARLSIIPMCGESEFQKCFKSNSRSTRIALKDHPIL